MALFQSLTHLGFLVSAAILFATPPAALAGDLPKEGTHDVTLSGAGTFKATPVGKSGS
jgi:hypothetical protein